MPRPTDKDTLLRESQIQFKKLLDLYQTFSDVEQKKAGACDKWSPKDILAHLHEWHRLVLAWEKVGSTGEKPEIPGPGYTWQTLPAFNDLIFQHYKDHSSDEIFALINQSYKDIQELIKSRTNEELFTKKYYKWTGTTSLGAYLVSCTSSHYQWAIGLLKKFKKEQFS